MRSNVIGEVTVSKTAAVTPTTVAGRIANQNTVGERRVEGAAPLTDISVSHVVEEGRAIESAAANASTGSVRSVIGY
jgi:hypothetical protein